MPQFALTGRAGMCHWEGEDSLMHLRLTKLILLTLTVFLLSSGIVYAEGEGGVVEVLSHSQAADVAHIVGEAFKAQDVDQLAQIVPHALPVLMEAAKLYPDDDTIFFALYICFSMNGENDYAYKAMRQAYRLTPDNLLYSVYFALSMKMNWMPVESRDMFVDISNAVGNVYQFELLVASMDMAIQDYDHAEKVLSVQYDRAEQVSEDVDVDRSYILSDIGYINLHRGNHAEAIKILEESVTLYPYNATAQARLGEALIKTGQIEQGIELIDEAMELNPTMGDALYYKGLGLEMLGKIEASTAAYKNAYTELRKSMKYSPDSGRDHYILAEICGKLGYTGQVEVYEFNAERLHYRYDAPFAKVGASE